jgi:hypothetical protein
MDTEHRDDIPQMIDMTDLEGDRGYDTTDRQHSARTDPSMRDGDSGRGNPYEYDPGDAEPGTDADVGDERDAEHSGYGGHSGGAVGGTPAGKRSSGGRLPPGEPVVTGSEARGDSTIGSLQNPDRPQPDPEEPPIPDYKYLSVPEVLEKVTYMTREQVVQVQRFESRHRKRKTLLTKLTRMLREPGPPRPPGDENE